MKDKRQGVLKKINEIGWMAVFMLIPIIAGFIFCMAQNISPSEVFLPNGFNNDEVFYYKQIEGIVQHGGPKGYFGYNESTAQIGTLGAWSPVIYLHWIIWGKLFGWTLRSPILCNLCLSALAFLLFYILVKPNKKNVIYMMALMSLFTPMSRYIFSCTPESMINALVIMCTGIVINLSNTEKVERFPAKWLSLLFLVVLLTLMRPYYVLGFVFVAFLGYLHTSKRRTILISGVLAFASIMLYFYIVGRYCASYFGPLIDTSWIKLILTSPIEGIKNAMYMFFGASKQYLQLMGTGATAGGLWGGWAFAYAFLLGWIVCRFRSVQVKEYRILYGLLLVCYLLMLMADFYLYDVRVGTRHLMAWIVVTMLVVIKSDANLRQKSLILVMTGWLFVVMALPETDYMLPVRSAEENDVTTIDSLPMVEGGEMSEWDYTVAWSPSSPHKVLYALPSGYGISCCLDNYLLENYNNIKSKYLVVLVDSEIDGVCKAENKRLIEEVGNMRIYALR